MEEKYEMLQTKVSPETYKRLKKIEAKKGLTSYCIIQMMADCIVRYMDDRHNLTPDMEKVMSIFEHMEGWKDALNIADPTVKKIVGEAIYFLYDEDGKKKGTRAVHVKRPALGDWEQDWNIQQIVEDFVCLTIPERYRRLRNLAEEMDCSSLLELFDKFIDHFSKEADMQELRRIFEDAERSDYGVRPERDTQYKRHQQRTMDMFEEHERRQKQAEESRKWLNENMDFKPHGYEW